MIGLSKEDLYLVITQKLIYPDKAKEKHMKNVRFSKDHLQGIVTLCFCMVAIWPT